MTKIQSQRLFSIISSFLELCYGLTFNDLVIRIVLYTKMLHRPTISDKAVAHAGSLR